MPVRHLAAGAPLLVALLLSSSAIGQDTSGEIPINARVIEHFEVGSDETRFGSFKFVGGLELTSSSRHLGGMSSIRMDSDRQHFIGVMDTGKWFSGRIERDDGGRMAAIGDFRVTVMRDATGSEEDRKWLVDAESLAVSETDLFVGFEREHRVDRYERQAFSYGAAVESLPLRIPIEEFRNNRGLETVALAPPEGPLGGALIIISERSLNTAGNIYGAVLDGPRAGVFFVRRDPPFDVTDGAFLPDGDLLLLERRFNIADGIGMRIRRIEADAIRPDATVDGEIVLEADFGFQIDNMEGLDVVEGPDGDVSLILVSDDNHSILQRSLLLEFRLAE
ncbi:esterase-like activity of phytase family protein [Pararhizobium haloflavum]|uniref:esterase-like activity of phytase family protein n=1 Tax=Pararhizobium haloflavum TaxID=2037914 RepID=UPI000C1974E3|nr:esterase-like activity of phytase family protein [Pararhizobium haloflavum]